MGDSPTGPTTGRRRSRWRTRPHRPMRRGDRATCRGTPACAPCATNVAISRTSGQRMSRSYDTSHRPPANPGSSCTRPVIAASSAVGSGAGTRQTRAPISAATRRKTSEGRRARGASLEDEKTRMRYRGVSRFGRGVGSSTGTGSGTASTSPNVKSSPRPAPVRHRRGAYTLPAAVRPNSRCVRQAAPGQRNRSHPGVG